MARLVSDANLNYVPLPTLAANIIASYISADTSARIFDPCAGEGHALARLGDWLGILDNQRYANEYHDDRWACMTRDYPGINKLAADALLTLQCSREAFGLAYINPPFSSQGKEQGGGRLEPLFFQRVIEHGRWVQTGGVVVLVTPQHVFSQKAALNHLARCYDDLRCYALPESIRSFGEVVVFGVVRAMPRMLKEYQVIAKELHELFAGDLPPLTMQRTPLYHVPAAKQIASLVWRDSNNATAEQAQADVVQTGGAWANPIYTHRIKAAREQRQHLRPLFPLSKVQAALRIAAGGINGQEVTIAGRKALVKGSTVLSEHTWTEQKDTDEATVTEKHTIVRRIPYVVTIDVSDGTIRQYTGDEGMAKLLEHEQSAHTLIEAASRTAPPVYAMDMPAAIATVLDGIVPANGKALAGYKPGLVPMQKHCVAAVYRGFEQHRNVILSAEMACGKSLMGLATAETLRKLAPTNKGRAFTVLLVAPNHLISEQNWIGEWRNALPEWHIAVLESPAQVGQFFRHARHSDQPCVGMLTLNGMRDASGRAIAATTHNDCIAWSDSIAFHMETMRVTSEQDREKTQFHATAKRPANVVQKASAASGSVIVTTEYGAGVSARTQRRDRLFRCGKLGGSGTIARPLYHYDGVYCPDCGRQIVRKAGSAHTAKSLHGAGLIACNHCGAVLGQMTRQQDNVQDRTLPVWEKQAAAPRLMPFGTRPTSNPRYPLGALIAKRYKGLVDLCISDEVHKAKGADTETGRIFGMLVSSSKRTLGLTGTLYGGKASTIFKLLYRMGNTQIVQSYGWEEESRFVKELGVVETIEREYVKHADAFEMSGKGSSTSVTVRERAGITPELAAIVQTQAVMVLLKQMGFHLPRYDEQVQFLDLPGYLMREYKDLVSHGKSIIRDGGFDAMGSYLQATLTYPVAPWQPLTVRSMKALRSYSTTPQDASLILPHHEWLAQHIANETSRNRRVLCFCEHTGKLDVMKDIIGKVQHLVGPQVNPVILRSTSLKKAAMRAAWFTEQEEQGKNLVLCHPQLVETGMNLIGWPSIVFVEPSYKLYVALQARKRAFRPTQVQDCTVTHLSYRETMQNQALDILGTKATAAGLLTGDDLSSGLFQFDSGMSLFQELAKRVMQDSNSYSGDIESKIAQASKAVAESMRAPDLVGVVAQLPQRQRSALLERARALMQQRIAA